MKHISSFLRKFICTHKNMTAEDFTILKKKLRYKFRSVGMLELDTLINNYINLNINKIDKDKAKLLYNLIDIDTNNLIKLFYFYSNKDNHNMEKLSHFLKNMNEKEIKDTYKLLIDILNNNERHTTSP
ncbi:conserved Plasmodium protein, unknown function [Plasmodium malariae]|uniref:FAD assembly factor SdhE n=1 Tax=Plasmodium malariae TaxID=5858 RepID=A0A1C3KA02_PLAMA|nr:conserved Plasmodium protein, unknown function [Plasmodium malariae]